MVCYGNDNKNKNNGMISIEGDLIETEGRLQIRPAGGYYRPW